MDMLQRRAYSPLVEVRPKSMPADAATFMASGYTRNPHAAGR
jgi:hypothetical protein